MKILVVDVGGTHVKLLVTGQNETRKLPSGPELTPDIMVQGVKELVHDWDYDVVTVGYPGLVIAGKVVAEPHNMGPGWVDFNLEQAFGRPVKLLNDAAMQALGSNEGDGIMLFLGLGTGLGSALVAHGVVVPLELAHLGYKKTTFEDYVGLRGLEENGKKKWRQHVEEVVATLRAAFNPDDIVLGGGNVKKLKELPPGCRLGANTNAFLGGFRLWDPKATAPQLKPREEVSVASE